MSTFQILWIIAGAITGWISVECFAIFKVKTPYAFNIGAAFVGALVGYTLAR